MEDYYRYYGIRLVSDQYGPRTVNDPRRGDLGRHRLATAISHRKPTMPCLLGGEPGFAHDQIHLCSVSRGRL